MILIPVHITIPVKQDGTQNLIVFLCVFCSSIRTIHLKGTKRNQFKAMK